MNELVKYFEALEARLAAQEARIAALEQQLSEKNQFFAELARNAEEQVAVTEAMGEQIKKVDALLEEALHKSSEPEVEVEIGRAHV